MCMRGAGKHLIKCFIAEKGLYFFLLSNSVVNLHGLVEKAGTERGSGSETGSLLWPADQ